jgi:hypothetical protein
MITKNPWAAREYVFERLLDFKTRGTSKEQIERAQLNLAAEIDRNIGQGITEGDNAVVAAWESAKEYLAEKIG